MTSSAIALHMPQIRNTQQNEVQYTSFTWIHVDLLKNCLQNIL